VVLDGWHRLSHSAGASLFRLAAFSSKLRGEFVNVVFFFPLNVHPMNGLPDQGNPEPALAC